MKLKNIIVISLLAVSGAQLLGKSVADLPAKDKKIVQERQGGLFFNRKPSVVKLDLSHRGLTSLDGLDKISGIETVTVLSLSHNELESLPEGTLDKMTGLKTIYLQGNKLKALPDHLFDKLLGLERLFLDHNKLVVMQPELFDESINLQRLALNDNNLSPKQLAALFGKKMNELGDGRLKMLVQNQKPPKELITPNVTTTVPGKTDQECGICLEEINSKSGEKFLNYKTPCDHYFHTSCLVDWVEKGNGRCPTCRGSLWTTTKPANPIKEA